MARERLNGNGAFVWAFSIDKETQRMIKELSRTLGLNNNSAVVRLAVRKLYSDMKR